jgi:O-acetyl-ADP-ribose deacetylase (regulator of RNase III)
MGAGIAGQIRMAAGSDVEREAMAKAPLTLGAAITTSGGKLMERGVITIIHAVVSESLGSPTREDIVRTAIAAAMVEADRHRLRSLLVPSIGSGLGPGRLDSGKVAVVTIEVVVAHMRRFATRLERIVLPQASERDVLDIQRALKEARELWWGT